MLVEATIQRIGGSTFARLPPDLVKRLGLKPGDTVQLNVTKRGMTGAEFQAWIDRNWKPEWATISWEEIKKDRGASKVDDDGWP